MANEGYFAHKLATELLGMKMVRQRLKGGIHSEKGLAFRGSHVATRRRPNRVDFRARRHSNEDPRPRSLTSLSAARGFGTSLRPRMHQVNLASWDGPPTRCRRNPPKHAVFVHLTFCATAVA